MNGTSTVSGGLPGEAALAVALVLGLASALLVSRRPAPPSIGVALGCVVLLAVTGLAFRLTMQRDVHYRPWVEVYAGDDPKLYIFLDGVAQAGSPCSARVGL